MNINDAENSGKPKDDTVLSDSVVEIIEIVEEAPQDNKPIPEPVVQKDKLWYLEAIRGLAALVVALNHYKAATITTHPEFNFWSLQSTYSHLYQVLWNGHFAVTLFFILSGRVLTLSILKKDLSVSTLKSIGSAIFRRPLRIGLPVFGALFLSMFLNAVGGYNKVVEGALVVQVPKTADEIKYGYSNFLSKPHEFTSFGQFMGWTISFFMNLPFDNLHYPFGVVWTLPIEIVGSWYIYLITMVVLVLPLRKNLLFLVITVFLWWANSWYSHFVAGLWLANLATSGAFKRMQRLNQISLWVIRLVLLFFFLVLLTTELPIRNWFNSWEYGQFYVNSDNPKIGTIGGKAATKSFFSPDEYTNYKWNEPDNSEFFAGICLLLLFEISPFLQRFFSMRPFKFIGRISYGVYLGHPFIFLVVMPSVFLSMQAGGLALNTIIGLGFLVYFPLVFVIGEIFYRVFDRPAINFAHTVRNFLFFEEDMKDYLKEGIKGCGKSVKSKFSKVLKRS